MNSYDEHFLDSNIIIGSILKWNKAHRDAYFYFKENYNKNISKRVYDECRSVFINNEMWTLRFIKELNDKFRKMSIINPKSKLYTFRDEFIKTMCAYDPYNCDNIERVIFSFVKDCEPDLLNIIEDSSNYGNFRLIIASTFQKALKSLDSICCGRSSIVNTYQGCPKDYSYDAPVQYSELSKLSVHKSDRLILLDSHYFRSMKIRKDMAFVTSDNEILKNGTKIEIILKGIHLFPPNFCASVKQA